MRTIVVLGAVFLLARQSAAPNNSSGAEASKKAIADSVRAVLDGLNAAWTRGDTAAVARVFASETMTSTASGRVLDRATVLKYIATQGADTGSSAGTSSMRDKAVHLLGAHREVAVCTAEVADVSGADTIVTQTTDVFERQPTGWMLVFLHESFVRPPRRTEEK